LRTRLKMFYLCFFDGIFFSILLHSDDIFFNCNSKSPRAFSTEESFDCSFSTTAFGAPKINFLLFNLPESCCWCLINLSISFFYLNISCSLSTKPAIGISIFISPTSAVADSGAESFSESCLILSNFASVKIIDRLFLTYTSSEVLRF